jgi:RecA-family ATPase
MFRCIAAISNVGGKCIEHFYADTPEGHQSAEAFVQQYNRDGWGVYDCVSLLKERRRAKSTVLEIPGLHWDIDARHVAEPKDKIIERVRQKLQEFGILSRLTDSGRGVHIYSIFREPIDASTPEADHSLFEAEYDVASGIPVWLPMEFHERWGGALAEGKRPTMSRNGAGWHIRSYSVNEALPTADDAPSVAPDAPKDDAPKAPFILRPLKKFDTAAIPPREFVFGRHYQRRTVSGTVAPGGTGKSSLVMVEAIAIATGRNLLDEEVKEQARVWYHNGEDNMLELQRRVGGICQHYNIPMEELEGGFFMTSGNEVPLRVAETWSQVRLQTDHRLVKCITEAIGDNRIDVAILDPLVTLHGVPENNPGQMDQVVRIFTRMADAQNCAIDLSHHTRKLAPGSSSDDVTIDDMRGAGAVKDAMRAVRMLNVMSPKDAENAGLMELERTNYFRIDRAKANYSGPAKTATWRQFVNVDLPNGDGVGVVTPWLFPGQEGAPASPQKLEAERKAEHVFLEILRRLTLAGRFVGERGNHNAPYVLAKEREAKMAKVGKAALDAAMRRLFDKQKIRIEEYMKADRHVGIRIMEI